MTSVISDQPFVFQATATTGGASRVGRTDTASAADLVRETQREISEIVREIAAVSRSDRDESSYWGFLADRLLRAMACEGVVIWRRIADDFSVLQRIGRITDRQIPGESIDTHHTLLREVARDANPVVVPPTPGADQADTPANPTQVPVALVPIHWLPSSADRETEDHFPRYLIEVFLEPGGGVATQRGYLRFITQAADLAAEFLKSAMLRRMIRDRDHAAAVDRITASLHLASQPRSIAERLCDQIVECFAVDRVAYVRIDPVGDRAEVLAVSHVDQINHRSETVAEMIASARAVASDQADWFDQAGASAGGQSDDLHLRGVLSPTAGGHDRVLLYAHGETPLEDDLRPHLIRLSSAAGQRMSHVRQLQAIPGARWWIGLAGTGVDSSLVLRGRRLRRTLICVALAVIAAMPMPLNLHAPAQLLAITTQNVTATRDAVIAQVHVRHGDRVRRGERLLTLRDDDLEERITHLQGQQRVLAERLDSHSKIIVDPTAADQADVDQASIEHQLIAVELEGVRRDLQTLLASRRTLSVVARHDGRIDAWRLQSDWRDRPVRRGEPLLGVIADETAWVVQAEFPQRRMRSVREVLLTQSRQHDRVTATIRPQADPNQHWDAQIDKIGPNLDGSDGAARSIVTFRLSDDAALQSMANGGDFHDGAPADVIVRAGSLPLALLLFQDVLDDAREWVAMYVGGPSASPRS